MATGSPSTQSLRAQRIGVILHDFPPGGSERVIIGLANLWAEAGRDVTIWCGSEAGPARRLVSDAVAVRPLSPAIPRGPGSRRRLGRAMAAALRPGEIDVLIAPGNFHMPVLAALARAGMEGAPRLLCKISNPLVRADLGPLRRATFAFVKRRQTRAIDLLVAMSPALRGEAAAVLRRSDIRTVAEPLRVSVRSSDRTQPPLIVVAGRLVAQKRVALALRAFAALARPARLVVLGDGPERATLEALSRQLDLRDRTTFAGHVADIGPWLTQASALLATSRYEGYPAVLIEAIAAGVPVVTTLSSPAIPEILAHPSFGIVARAEPHALAAALSDVLDAPRPDDAARDALRVRHDADRVATAWLDLLDESVR